MPESQQSQLWKRWLNGPAGTWPPKWKAPLENRKSQPNRPKQTQVLCSEGKEKVSKRHREYF
jgi:hypothetical protein